MFREAAAFAKTGGSQNWEMEFWLNCGRVLLEEEKYENAVEYFTASLEVAMQMTDEQKKKAYRDSLQAVVWDAATSWRILNQG